MYKLRFKMIKQPRNLTGQTFGRLTVVKRAEQRSKGGAISWDCACECGGQRTTTGSALLSGNTSSCGCIKRTYESSSEGKYLLSRVKEINSDWLSVPLVRQ